jgi:hypothetical protein
MPDQRKTHNEEPVNKKTKEFIFRLMKKLQ